MFSIEIGGTAPWPGRGPFHLAHEAEIACALLGRIGEPARPDDFRMLALPTLILQGSCSPLPTRRISELLARALPEVRTETIDGAGHMAPMTHRDEVNDLIFAHLDANRAPRRTAGAALEVA